METGSLFDLKHSIVGRYLAKQPYPWAVLSHLEQILPQLVAKLPDSYRELAPKVWVGPGTFIEKTALIQGPAIIGANCQIRHAAFVRDQVICGDGVVIGNCTEVKNAILFDQVQVPHFNYVGDSILGYRAHLGAGAILSNFKATGDEIKVEWSGQRISTGLNKLGGLIGDRVEIGCNAVVYPGTIIGRDSIIYPLTSVRGRVPARRIIKADGKTYPLE